jgi:hypothetical protein
MNNSHIFPMYATFISLSTKTFEVLIFNKITRSQTFGNDCGVMCKARLNEIHMRAILKDFLKKKFLLGTKVNKSLSPNINNV